MPPEDRAGHGRRSRAVAVTPATSAWTGLRALSASPGRVAGVRVLRGADASRAVFDRASAVVMVRRPEAGDRVYEVVVFFADGREPLPLGPLMDDTEIIAHWRRMAAGLGLPMLVQRPDGSLFAPYDQIGRVLLGPLRYRRRNATLSRRRPRFLQWRKPARMPDSAWSTRPDSSPGR